MMPTAQAALFEAEVVKMLESGGGSIRQRFR
jgi:hypothetical protein